MRQSNWLPVVATGLLGVAVGILLASGRLTTFLNARAAQPAKGQAKEEGVKLYKGQFNGKIGRTFDESEQAWPAPVRAKPGTPNVLFIVLDDVGFSQLGSYGGLAHTPNLDKLAKNGLRYNNFHTTALCSPTRAALLTGRNHHSNGLGVIAEFSTGFPGYNGAIPFQNGFLSEILTQFGFATFCLGKWHLTPDQDMNMAAGKERWPLGRGFERFYGFLGGDTHHYYPDLVYDNHPVEPPKTPEQGYHFTDDMTDKAIEFIRDLRNVTPDKPFFCYYSTGAMHAPHHVRKEWIAKYKGKFDMGWDKAREIVLAKQKKLGVIPQNAVLSPRNKEVRAWATLTQKQKSLYSYMMEVYAGMMEHTDHEIGRVLNYLESTGQMDNTLIVVVSDNGASAEGGVNGLLNEGSFFNGVTEDVDFLWQNRARLGGPNSYNHYPWGWTLAGNTPFKKWKREIYLGGIRDPLIVHWPKGIKAKGDIRTQYAHAIDVLPTVLDVLKITPPKRIKGYAQSPIEGVSFAHSFDDAKAPSKRTTQYYEMFGSRAIYHDGWVAISPHFPQGKPMTEKALRGNRWELYHTDTDFSQTNDLAKKNPEKLREMVERWWAEAGKYKVLPLDSMRLQRINTPRPELTEPRSRYVYQPDAAQVKSGVAAPTINRSYKITADVIIPKDGANGVLLAHGGNFGGWSMFVKDERLHFTYNWQGRKYYEVSSPNKIPAGKVTLSYKFQRSGNKEGAGGTGQLYVNGKLAGSMKVEKTNPVLYWPHNEGLTCGYDALTPAVEGYRTPYRFTGTIRKVVVDVLK